MLHFKDIIDCVDFSVSIIFLDTCYLSYLNKYLRYYKQMRRFGELN